MCPSMLAMSASAVMTVRSLLDRVLFHEIVTRQIKTTRTLKYMGIAGLGRLITLMGLITD